MAEDKEIKDILEEKEKSKKAKKEKKAKTKQQKCAIVLGIIWGVLFVLTLGTRIAILPNMPTYNTFLYMILPKSVNTVFEDKELTLYVEKNKDFDKSKDLPINAIKIYYYKNNDTSTEKIYLKDGLILHGEKETSNFMGIQVWGDAIITYNIIVGILNKVLIALAVILGFYLIYVWYVVWSIKYDKQHNHINE